MRRRWAVIGVRNNYQAETLSEHKKWGNELQYSSTASGRLIIDRKSEQTE